MSLFWIIDESLDDLTYPQVCNPVESFMKAFKGELHDGSAIMQLLTEWGFSLQEDQHNLTKCPCAVYRWKEKFERNASPNCKRRFLSGSCQYLESIIDEKRLNGCKESTLEEYHEFRRRNAGTTPFFALIEYARGIDLPDDVFNDDIFSSLYWTAVDVTAYSNVSFH